MRYLLGIAIAPLLFFTFFSSAYAQVSMQSQVDALLAQIAQLQLLLAQVRQVPTPTPTPTYQQPQGTPLPSGSALGQCPNLIRTLGPGASGGDVANLQAFLAGDPTLYPEAKITAYYGALTQQAVERFQIRYGVVSSGSPSTTGFGSVGAATRAVIA